MCRSDGPGMDTCTGLSLGPTTDRRAMFHEKVFESDVFNNLFFNFLLS